ncbi:MAG TPA: arylamine N-acetyltransferase [Phototrophicaceae bacterium]|nr:arylamine N-acetyltransferase [Phototrophicaceae bacterium]
MMATTDLLLKPDHVRQILDYLEVEVGQPDLTWLNQLITAYTEHVPWESASRIVRRANISKLAERPRRPAEFWEQAMTQGAGGTCFESNLAFISLLRAVGVGYEGYLTINDMGDFRGCHTAMVIMVDEEKYLVDAGFPLYAALPIHPGEITQVDTPYQHNDVRPIALDRYEIERIPHPKLNCYTLIDQSVNEVDYIAATTADYDVNGLFLDRMVITKVVNGRVWRFNSGEKPYHLEMFHEGVRYDTPIEGDSGQVIGEHFGIDTEIVSRALALI